jgi:effector-binding domain-containing protein
LIGGSARFDTSRRGCDGARERCVEHPVRIMERTATPTAVVPVATSWDAFPALWGQLLDEVWAFVRGAGLSAGHNVMLYKDDVPNVEVGVEIASPFTPSGRVVSSALPAGRVAMTVGRGPLSAESIDRAHRAVIDWCAANRHALDGTRWEVYGHERGDAQAMEIEVCWLLRR